MKHLLLLVLLVISMAATAQESKKDKVQKPQPVPELVSLPIDSATHMVTYSAVVPVPNATKDALFGRAQLWFATPQVSAHMAQTIDSAASIMVGQGVSEVILRSLGSMWEHVQLFYTVKLSVKQGRYKYELTDFYFQEYPTHEAPQPIPVAVEAYVFPPGRVGRSNTWDIKHQQQLRIEAERLVANIKIAMRGNDNW